MTATIYYDGDCPFCRQYTQLLRLREQVGQVNLIDVRKDSVARDMLFAAGLDLDQGMALDLNGELFWGADAVHRLSLLSTDATWFNKLNTQVFNRRPIAALLYPLMRAGRSIFFFATGRQRIRPNSAAEMSVFAIFAHAFGMYAIADFLYALYLGSASTITYCAGAMGAYLFARPRSPRVFTALSVSMLIGVALNMPTNSNHAILILFTLLAGSIAAAVAWLTGRSWIDFVATFAPIGRALLLTMYFFGVFHKINTGFLDPQVSCAVSLWQQMPWPISAFDPPWWRHVIIYGTLFGEAAIFIGLLNHRARHAAMMLGIAFHSMLALSNWGFYLAFSTLTISLHLLFLSPGGAARITAAPSWRLLQARMHTISGLGALCMWVTTIAMLANIGHFNSISLIWLPWPIWLICLVARYGRERKGETTIGRPILSNLTVLNILSVAFIFNCLTPLLGLKNTQAMNMFANLTYDSGHSNHLIISSTGPFRYLSDSAQIMEVNGKPFDSRGGDQIPYYGLLDRAEREPSTIFKFIRNGHIITANAADLDEDIKKQLHPNWVRAWLHFRPFNTHTNQACEPGT